MRASGAAALRTGAPAAWIAEEYRGLVRFSLSTARKLCEQHTAFQRIEIFDTLAMGKVLVLDGVFQLSAADEHVYHELLTHPAMTLAPRIERVLIVGGGDGGTAREVLRYRQVKQVVMVEIDEAVVTACRKHLPELGGEAFADARLSLRFEDAAAYVQSLASGSFDVVLVDGSDPVGPGEALFGTEFFTDCRRALRRGGVYAMQSGAPLLMPEVFYPTVRALREVFGDARPVFGEVPLYASGTWSWTIAAASVNPKRARLSRIAPFETELRTYSRELHAAAFVPAAQVARRLRSCGVEP